MKKISAVAVMMLIASIAFAETFTAPMVPRKAPPPQKPVPLPTRPVGGVIPRAVRGGNPLQMLNPFARRKDGTAEENVVLDPNVPGKWDGIKLLSISF